MASFVRGFAILLRRWGRRRRRPRRRPWRRSRHRRRRGPLEVVEDALDRAARVGLDGDEAEDVLGAQRGEGLAGVQSGVEPQARLRERFEEPVVVEPPRAARRELREDEVDVGRRQPRRKVWRLRHQPPTACGRRQGRPSRRGLRPRSAEAQHSFQRLVRAIALGRREALDQQFHQAQCLQLQTAGREVILKAAAKCSHRWFVSSL